MANVLVLANQTIGGQALLDAVRERHAAGDARFFVVVPQSKPSHGNVIYDETVRDAAQVRVDLALEFMAQEGIDGTGEVGDADPFSAAKDAIAHHRIDEVIVSTLPSTSSGWLRKDLPERIEHECGLSVKHVVTDLAREGLPFGVCLVVANQTMAGDELVSRLKARRRRARAASSWRCRSRAARARRRDRPARGCTSCSPPCPTTGSSPPGSSPTPTPTQRP